MKPQTLPTINRSLTRVIKTPDIRPSAKSKKPVAKSKKTIIITVPDYPAVLMPQQSGGYLKPRKYDFF